MRHLAVPLLGLLLFCGCQTCADRDYHLTGQKRSDAERVTRVLTTVASQTGFHRGVALQYDSPALVIFRATDMDLRAFRKRTEIRITLWRRSWSARRAFDRTDRLLIAQLRGEFGGRMVIDPLDHPDAIITVY